MTSPAWVCPACHGSLRDASDALACSACDARWPVRHGIPDLRTGGDQYLAVDDDLRAADALASRTADGWRGMLAWYYATNAKVTAAQAQRFVAGVEAAVDRAAASLVSWQHLAPATPGGGRRALDLGTGTGPLAIAMAREGWSVSAVDAGLRWLVVAAQRCREAGVSVRLACANAEALPHGSSMLDLVGGEGILENTDDAHRSLAEAARVLGTGGALWLSMPNKHFAGPDPHVGMWGGSLLPDRVVARWAERRGMVPPRRTLFSSGGARRALRDAGFRDVKVRPPRIAAAQAAGLGAAGRAAVRAFQLASGLPVARDLLVAIGPSFLITGRRP